MVEDGADRPGRARPSADPFRRYAERFGRTPAAATAGRATFFPDLLAPTAERDVRVCVAAACFAASAGGHHLGQVATAVGVPADGAGDEVSLRQVRCLGYCYAAPAALVDEETCTGPDLADQVRGVTARRDPPVPVYCDSPVPVVTAGLLGAEETWQVWPRVVRAGRPDVVLEEVERAGLRGRGGAGFPTARKWRTALEHPPPRVVVANGDEGDPGSFVDRLLMESDPHRLLEGLVLACYAVGAHEAVVFVRSEYPRARRSLEHAVAEAYDAGHLGPDPHHSGYGVDVRVEQGAGSYVSGEETALLNGLEGLRGVVRPRPPYPTEHGLHGRPTVVNNVETLAAVPWIVRHGGSTYTRLGLRDETGTVVVSLSEAFARPGAYEVQVGVSLHHVVGLGHGLRDGRRLRALQVGGPLGGFLGPEHLDLPLSEAGLGTLGLSLGHGGLVAFDDRVPGQEVLRNLWRFVDAESCGQCSPCRTGSRRGLGLVDAAGPGAEPARERTLRAMAEASLCAFGRRVPAAVRSLARVYDLEGWPR